MSLRLLSVLPIVLFAFLISCHRTGGNAAPLVVANGGSSVKIENLEKPPEEVKPTENPVIVKFESEPCKPDFNGTTFSQSNCDAGLVCVGNLVEQGAGTCRVDCGVRDGKDIYKLAEHCPAGRTCQLLNEGSQLDIGAYCLPQQGERNGMCYALDDVDACGHNRTCTISDLEESDQGVSISSMVCRDRCPFGDENAAATCGQGESCHMDKYSQVWQKKDDKPVGCSVKECHKRNNPLCGCDKKHAYICRAMVPGEDDGVCIRPAGLCALDVKGVTKSDIESGQLPVCNEVSDHRFCDSSAYQNSRGAHNFGRCMPILGDNTGFCFDICQSETQASQTLIHKLSCGAGYECTTDMAKAFQKHFKTPPFMVPIANLEQPGTHKSCSAKKCQDGAPCPSECGGTEVYCAVENDENGGETGVCSEYLSTCQPIAAPVPPALPPA